MKAAWSRVNAEWQARLIRVGLAFVVAIALLAAVDASPSVPLLAGLVVATLGLWFAMATPTATQDRSWVAGDLTGAGLWRGSDHATTSLAEHLARIEASPATTEELTRLVHDRLRAILEAWVWRTQQVDLRRNADWATSLLPRDLADFYRGRVDPQDLRQDRLDHLLTRIENL